MATYPAEQTIVDQIETWLADIRKTNDYHTDAGLRVGTEEPGEIYNPEDPDLPAILVLDESATSAAKVWTQQLVIEGAVSVDSDSARATCRLIQTDIVYALRKGLKASLHNTGVIRALRITGKEIPRREPGETLLTPTVTVEVEYHDPAQP